MRITQGAERCPNDFDLVLTERYPGKTPTFAKAGDPCQVKAGADLLITGYVDRVIRSMDSGGHEVRITGRGKCQDLVDASAEYPGCEINQSTLVNTAAQLAAPYGIAVKTANNPDLGQALPSFNITLEQTPWSIIEEMTRFYAVLAYEDPNGDLVISAVGVADGSSGFAEGSNVQKATFTEAADQRFSDYDAFLLNMDVLGDLGDGGNLKANVKDPNVLRHRMKAIIAESPAGGQNIAFKRAHWEAARRAGRGTLISLTADCWRDAAGALWRPNTLVPVALPSLRVPTGHYCISEVTFIQDAAGGKTAQIVLMPKSAFQPEPIQLQPPILDL